MLVQECPHCKHTIFKYTPHSEELIDKDGKLVAISYTTTITCNNCGATIGPNNTRNPQAATGS